MDKELLELLVCPQCKGPLEQTSDKQGLSCTPCACVYPIREGIPALLKEEAIPIHKWDTYTLEQNK